MTNYFTHNLPIEFICNSCQFNTRNKKDYNRHILTRKHLNLTTTTDIIKKTHQCVCGKTYNHISSLCNHKKGCLQIISPIEYSKPLQDVDPFPTNLIFELIKQNQEFKQLLIDQNQQLYEKHEENIDLQKQLLDVVKDSKTINNNTISNNSHNKTFNLQFFLNETCKDAMNMKDFIKSLELTMPELEKMGELGFAEGMSRLFVNRLNSMDITKRPIHCSDIKREIIHIKDDNKWERDNANLDRLRKIIKQITHKNIVRVDDWKKANPGCTEYNSRKYDHYLKLTMETIGPIDEVGEKRDFGKIIRRVAENTFIDKKYLLV